MNPMKQVTYGILAGVVVALVLVPLLRLIADRWHSRRQIVGLQLLGGILFLSLLAYYEIRTEIEKDVLAWGQRVFGFMAGIALFSWLGHATKELVIPPQAPAAASSVVILPGINTPKNAEEGEKARPGQSDSKWWSSEPWRALALISLIVTGAVLFPHLPNWLKRLNQFKLGEFEVKFRESVNADRKLNLDRERQGNNIAHFGQLKDYAAMEERVNSDFRHLMRKTTIEKADTTSPNQGKDTSIICGKAHGRGNTVPPDPVRDAELGGCSFLALQKQVLAPAFKCAEALVKGGISVDIIRGFTRELAWHYRTMLRQVETKSLTPDDLRLGKTAKDWMKQFVKFDKSHCDCKEDIKEISLDQAMQLHKSVWTYLVLAYLDYFNEDRLAAIELLQPKMTTFSESMSLFAFLGQLWSEEGHTLDAAIEADRQVQRIASTMMQQAQGIVDTKSPVSAEVKKYNEDDFVRARKALAIAENREAYNLVLSDSTPSSKGQSTPQELAISAVKSAYADIVPCQRRAEKPVSINLHTAESDQVLSFWASVDTYALTVLASIDIEHGTSKQAACAEKLLENAKKSYGTYLDKVVQQCASIQCSDFRLTYPGVEHDYRIISSHYALAREVLEKYGGADECSNEEMWNDLKLNASCKEAK